MERKNRKQSGGQNETRLERGWKRMMKEQIKREFQGQIGRINRTMVRERRNKNQRGH